MKINDQNRGLNQPVPDGFSKDFLCPFMIHIEMKIFELRNERFINFQYFCLKLSFKHLNN